MTASPSVTRYHTMSGSIYEVEVSLNPIGTRQYRVRTVKEPVRAEGEGSKRATSAWAPALWARDTGAGLVIVWDIEEPYGNDAVVRSTQTSPVTLTEYPS